jgi:hypothetical protein
MKRKKKLKKKQEAIQQTQFADCKDLRLLPINEYIRIYLKGDYSRLCDKFIEFFHHFELANYARLEPDVYDRVNQFLAEFLYIIAKQNFVIPQTKIAHLMALMPIISNVISMSAYRSTDSVLELLRTQQNNFHKVLALLSPRNAIRFDYGSLFETEALATSYWYFTNYWASGTLTNRIVWENMREHQRTISNKLVLTDPQLHFAYFASTYIDSSTHQNIKRKINELVKESVKEAKIVSNPDGKTIAIVTAKWFKASSVYRCYSRAVMALGKHYDLELVHIGDDRPDLDIEGFKKVHRLHISNMMVHLGDLVNNTFTAAFYPDIGMSIESIYAANMRLAPIQITSYGHPASTFGAEIDYFLGREDQERLEDAEINYSERLVTIPASGHMAVPPNHLNAAIAMESAKDKLLDKVVINCPWSQDKTNWHALQVLKRIKDGTKRNILFRFFPNEGLLRLNYCLSYMRDIYAVLGDSAEVNLVFGQEYINRMACGDMAVDSMPFSGSNTVIDALSVGMPTVCLDGRKMFERMGAGVLKDSGIAGSGLIADDEDGYVARAIFLIENDDIRKEMRELLIGLNPIQRIFTNDRGDIAANAIKWLIDNHVHLKASGRNNPIVLTGEEE